MWEQNWRYHGLPSLGDFIQVQGHKLSTHERYDNQGIVTSIIEQGDAIFVRLNNENPEGDKYACMRWRKWLGPEIEQTIKRKKKVHA